MFFIFRATSGLACLASCATKRDQKPEASLHERSACFAAAQSTVEGHSPHKTTYCPTEASSKVPARQVAVYPGTRVPIG
eukprot:scaffold463_cov242-Pinguiococcus_pyrenoidosus.AAC.5